MSRQRDFIRKKAAELGLTIRRMDWTPIGVALEKCGPMGGWEVETYEAGIMVGYNVREVAEAMKMALELQKLGVRGAQP